MRKHHSVIIHATIKVHFVAALSIRIRVACSSRGRVTFLHGSLPTELIDVLLQKIIVNAHFKCPDAPIPLQEVSMPIGKTVLTGLIYFSSIVLMSCTQESSDSRAMHAAPSA